ncbi:MAG: PD-(D/E)XK nuclease family protein [bacterium]
MTQSPLFEAIESGVTVITATRRLSRELTQQYDRARQHAGDTAWASADILPWNAWINRSWMKLEFTLSHSPIVLSEGQTEAIWTQIIVDDIHRYESDSAPLWSTKATARAAIKTLELIRNWRIDTEQLIKSPQVDHRCFVRWFNAYNKKCAKNNWVDQHQLAELLRLNAKELDFGKIELVGFDRLLPQQQALIDTANRSGAKIHRFSFEPVNSAAISYSEFDDDLSQWLAAGQWIRSKLETEPDCKIALVAPDLAKSMQNIDYALRQTLCPGDIVDVADRSKLPFHLSLGTRLAKHPVAESALGLLLVFGNRNISIDRISGLILSPHISGAAEELTARGMLDIQLRQRLPTQTNYRRALEFLEFEFQEQSEDSCPLLRKVLYRCNQLVDGFPSNSSFSNWSKQFDQLLGSLGWPGSVNSNSEAFQVVKAVREQLHQLGELDLASSAVSFESALSWLRQRLENKVFQVETSEPQVEVLGVLEMSGLNVDYLWFGGLVETDWPPRLNPDPFISTSIQRQAGIEKASTTGMLEFAQIQQRRLFDSAGEIICSRHQYESETTMEPSPLISELNSTPALAAEVPATVDQTYNFHRPAFDIADDRHGPPLLKLDAIPGGTGLIQAQSQCPRGAFARFRLGAEPMFENEPGLDNLQRGSLVHKVLEQVWVSLGSSRELGLISTEQLVQLVTQYSQHALGRFKPGSGCGDQYFLSVERWIVNTAMEWLQLEQLRAQPFEVSSVETQCQLELAGLSLSFRIDRIDRLDDGAIALIDYKTGSRNTISNWLSDRPSSPQLPLYTLSQHTPIEAVIWAQVRPGQCRFIGLSNQHTFGAEGASAIGVKKFEQDAELMECYGNWAGMLRDWNRVLDALALEFINGDARQAPSNHGICSACPTPVICRNGDRVATDEAT